MHTPQLYSTILQEKGHATKYEAQDIHDVPGNVI